MAEIAAAPTPMMRQYLELKERYSDCILFFRLGDFYEMREVRLGHARTGWDMATGLVSGISQEPSRAVTVCPEVPIPRILSPRTAAWGTDLQDEHGLSKNTM
jgi:hypothetical protein